MDRMFQQHVARKTFSLDILDEHRRPKLVFDVIKRRFSTKADQRQ
jgi:hypothetical protein